MSKVAMKRLFQQETGTSWTGQTQVSSYGNGNLTKNINGQAIYAYINSSGEAYVSFASSIGALLGGSTTLGNPILVTALPSTSNTIMGSLNFVDDKLFLFLAYYDPSVSNQVCKLWVDSTGVGDSFSLFSTVDPVLTPSGGGSLYETTDARLTTMIKLSNGSYAIVLPRKLGTGGTAAYYWHKYLFISSDGGATWSMSSSGANSGYVYTDWAGRSLMELSAGVIVAHGNGTSSGFWIVWSSYGSSMTTYSPTGWSGSNYSMSMVMFKNEIGDIYTYVCSNGILKYTGPSSPTISDLLPRANWTSLGIYSTTGIGLIYVDVPDMILVGKTTTTVTNEAYGMSYKSWITSRIRNLRTISGTEGGRNFADKVIAQQGYSSTGLLLCNWVQKTNGEYMSAYVNSSTKEIITATCADTSFLTSNYGVDSIAGSGFYVSAVSSVAQCTLCKRPDGKVLLIVADHAVGLTNVVVCYISNSGNGDDWAFYSNALTNTAPTAVSGTDFGFVGTCITETGRIVLPGSMGYYISGYSFLIARVLVSDDNGLTWTTTLTTSYVQGVRASGAVTQLPDGTIVFYRVQGSGSAYFTYSINNGASWNSVDISDDFSDALVDNVYGFSFYYDALSGKLYGHCNGVIGASGFYYLDAPTVSNLCNKADWKQIETTSENNTNAGTFSYSVGTLMVFQESSGAEKATYAIPFVQGSPRRRHLLHKIDDTPTWGGISQ